jgi:hypothetical protein
MTLIDRLSKLDAPCGHYTAMEMAIHSPFKNKERELFIEALNGSVDAAIALAERVLPGGDAPIRTKQKMAWLDGNKGQICYGATPAIALLRAKEASNEP